MRRALLLATFLLGTPAFAGLTLPEGGLPAGRLAVEPVVTARQSTLVTVNLVKGFMRGAGSSLPGASEIVALDADASRYAAGALLGTVPGGLWAEIFDGKDIDPNQRARIVEAFRPYLARAAEAAAKDNADIVTRLQREINAGRLGQGDLEDAAAALRGLSAHNPALKASLSDVASALEVQKSRGIAAIVGEGTRSWQRKGSEELGTPVVGREHAFSQELAPAGSGSVESARRSIDLPAPKAAAPAAPSPSKFKAVMRWLPPILAGVVLFAGIDWGTKFLASKYLFSVFHEASWRKPLMAFVVPFIFFTAFKARAPLASDHNTWSWSIKRLGNGKLGFYKVEISGLDTMLAKHPSLRWARRLYDVSIAMMLGGMIGNGLDLARLGGALDWIPVGRSLMNFADVAVLLGLAFFQLATHFFVTAARADHEKKLLNFNTGNFLALPIVGFFIAWAFGSGKGGEALDLSMKSIGFLYLMGFSMLIGISRVIASSVVGHFAGKFVEEQDAAKPKA